MFYNNYYLSLYRKTFNKLNIKTMDKTRRTSKEYLFALCITDGLFEEMNEIQKSILLNAISEVKNGDIEIPSTHRERLKKTPKKHL